MLWNKWQPLDLLLAALRLPSTAIPRATLFWAAFSLMALRPMVRTNLSATMDLASFGLRAPIDLQERSAAISATERTRAWRSAEHSPLGPTTRALIFPNSSNLLPTGPGPLLGSWLLYWVSAFFAFLSYSAWMREALRVTPLAAFHSSGVGVGWEVGIALVNAFQFHELVVIPRLELYHEVGN